MKDMNWLIWKLFLLFLALLVCVNLLAWNYEKKIEDKTYKVSINRISHDIQRFEKEKKHAVKTLQELVDFAETDGYPKITGILNTGPEDDIEEKERFWANTGEDYAVFATKEHYYKIMYDSQKPQNILFLWINGTAAMFLAVIIGVLFYIRREILRPFHQFSNLPYQLSKGNLTIPIQENKNRFFGRFLWGVDLLREHLEKQKQREMELEKEKKLLLLSLSHDLKTPLSAIKLYAGALSRNLYQQDEKKQEIAKHINQKADEIEKYISEIVHASNEDFLDFQVQCQEIYIGKVLEEIGRYYQEKMGLKHIDFRIGTYRDCLVYADFDRLVEVIQNVVENAIKYGDGAFIRIDTERQEEEYLIIITNSGCDLPSKELLHIFDSFFRGSNVSKQTGSGLGLYICRQLMHRMEGEITAAADKNGTMEVVVALRVL